MNGTMPRPTSRSVQLAVMAAPSTSVADAVAEARRRHAGAGAWFEPAPPARRGSAQLSSAA